MNEDIEKSDGFYKKFYDENRIAILQYGNLRKHFRNMIHNILGEHYYNMGMDVYECDRLTCEDITKKASKTFNFKKLKRRRRNERIV